MVTRAVFAAALLLTPLAAQAAPKHHHAAARVSTATYHASGPHKPVRVLRAHHRTTHTRLAAAQTHHHPLSRGS